MSNLETRPRESVVGGASPEQPSPAARTLDPREVPLGGPRGLLVRRTLPHREIRTVGAWCFVDHYGPVDRQSMRVPPHPHTGLQTVSWLLEGEVLHRDSVGSEQLVRPGELNLMTAGHGIAHSEYSVGAEPLHGVQLWVALPDAHRHQAPHFEHHDDLPRTADGGLDLVVLAGALAGQTSSALTYSPLVGAQVRLAGGASAALPLERGFEHAVLSVDGELELEGALLPRGSLRYLGWGRDSLQLAATEAGAVALLLGGEPFAESLLMWWNFVGRSHDEVALARAEWEAGERFGPVAGDDEPPLPAPALPTTPMRPRPSRRGS